MGQASPGCLPTAVMCQLVDCNRATLLLVPAWRQRVALHLFQVACRQRSLAQQHAVCSQEEGMPILRQGRAAEDAGWKAERGRASSLRRRGGTCPPAWPAEGRAAAGRWPSCCAASAPAPSQSAHACGSCAAAPRYPASTTQHAAVLCYLSLGERPEGRCWCGWAAGWRWPAGGACPQAGADQVRVRTCMAFQPSSEVMWSASGTSSALPTGASCGAARCTLCPCTARMRGGTEDSSSSYRPCMHCGMWGGGARKSGQERECSSVGMEGVPPPVAVGVHARTLRSDATTCRTTASVAPGDRSSCSSTGNGTKPEASISTGREHWCEGA